jgi:hypothetical protein
MDAVTLLAYALALVATLDIVAARIGHGPTRRAARSRRY